MAGEKSKVVNIAIMTVSYTRTEENDKSGNTLVERLKAAGHHLANKKIVVDEMDSIQKTLKEWIADPEIDAVIATGGTGVTGRDVTPEAFEGLYDKPIPGFGELFRYLSYKNIKTSTIQSRATGGVANGTILFAVPGSTGACKDAWDEIIMHQLNSNNKPCNLVELMPRMLEK
ncbi:MAG: molybdenum cofactor biosynthesis protein B [Nitrospinota bacterium]|nr:molybdenum cofactor biosynthesis protein B [Nitrospinota bacterium]